MKLKVYEYSNCSTCKKALKFLDEKRVPYDRIPIVESPPPKADLKRMLGYLGGDFKKLFNTSGQVYREMGLSEKLANMNEEQALRLLAENGKLVKRPFALNERTGAVGFREEIWKKIF